jgi:Fe2+ or Zn2+ uptake regulation protein
MNYNEYMTAHRRLAILTLLAAANAYTLHEIDLKKALIEQGQAASTDVLRSDLQWLHEQGLVLAKQPDGDIWLATLTAKGGDVRQGLSTVPGVARPEPGAR